MKLEMKLDLKKGLQECNAELKKLEWLILLGLTVPCGCVTSHQAEARVYFEPDSVSGESGEPLEGILMTVFSQSLESEGHYWVVQGESDGMMVPRQVSLSWVVSGQLIRQKGVNVFLLGPYARGKTPGYEYWIFLDGFCPVSFGHRELERAAERGEGLTFSLQEIRPGLESREEAVLDGARRVVEMIGFLDAEVQK